MMSGKNVKRGSRSSETSDACSAGPSWLPGTCKANLRRSRFSPFPLRELIIPPDLAAESRQRTITKHSSIPSVLLHSSLPTP